MVELYLSKEELRLIDAVKKIQYGQLFNVTILDMSPEVKQGVSGDTAKLIEMMREEGITHIDELTVHCSEPKEIVVYGTTDDGIRYKKRIRI